MRILLLSIGLHPLFAVAQPSDDFFLQPCGPPASYGVALQDVRRSDLEVVSSSQGTDDVPSSSGHCTRGIVNRAHARFLYDRDRNGAWVILHPDSGDVLHPDSLQKGIAAGRLRWDHGHLPVCYMGYGSQHDGKGWHLMEEREWKRSIVRVETPDAVYLVSVLVECVLPDGIIEVRGRRVVLEGEPLPIH